MLASSTNWGPVLFATLIPLFALVLGGLISIIFRLGRLTEQVENLEEDVRRLTAWRSDRGYPS